MIVVQICLLSRKEVLSLFGFVVSIISEKKKNPTCKQLEDSSLSN